jgi:nucleoside-diphosphate-sugar epimerase
MARKIILVTGATGFVGSVLCRTLLSLPFVIRTAVWVEEKNPVVYPGCESIEIDSIGPSTDWKRALAGVDIVIHLAARVHVMHDNALDPISEFRRVNTDGTRRLAEEAVAGGVRRLVYISTVKVNGEEKPVPYREVDPPNPGDPYGVSKLEAEQFLRSFSATSGLETVILRPPLVYGPGVRANFLRLLETVYRGVPLPLASIRNLRSLVFVGNLADAIAICSTHPAAAGKTYLVSDGEGVSSGQLVRMIAGAMDKPSRVFPFPVWAMKLAGIMTGKGEAVGRLTTSLAVDSTRIRNELGWVPPFTLAQGIQETCRWFLAQKQRNPSYRVES